MSLASKWESSDDTLLESSTIDTLTPNWYIMTSVNNVRRAFTVNWEQLYAFRGIKQENSSTRCQCVTGSPDQMRIYKAMSASYQNRMNKEVCFRGARERQKHGYQKRRDCRCFSQIESPVEQRKGFIFTKRTCLKNAFWIPAEKECVKTFPSKTCLPTKQRDCITLWNKKKLPSIRVPSKQRTTWTS
jgi:hypothetical protein